MGCAPFHLVFGKEALLPVEVELPAIKMLEKMMEMPTNAFATRLLYLEEAQLNSSLELEHYESMQDLVLKRVNAKVKSKGICQR